MQKRKLEEEISVKYRVWLSIIFMFSLLTGCSLVNGETNSVAEGESDTLGLTPDFSYEVIEQVPHILVNQIGYPKEAVKVGILQGENLEESFYVYNGVTNRKEYQGTLEQSGLSGTQIPSGDKNSESMSSCIYLADFSSIEKEGTYYLYHPDLGYSYEFKIQNNVYEDMEKAVLTEIEKEKNNTALMCYQLAGLLMTKELYADYILEPERLETVCREKVERLLLAQDDISGSVYADLSDVERLKRLNETEKQQYISLAATAEFAGVMAGYAYQIKESAPDFSGQCQRVAEEAYRSIQTSLDNVGFDAGYFAATQLYRLTGWAKYHQAIDQYFLLKEEQKSYTEYDFSLFADYAYLSISYGVNLEWSDFIMKKIMKQAEEISLTSGKNNYYVSEKREYNDIDGKLRDMSNLALVNYIITNHEYSTLQRNYMDFFLGRNPGNVCLVNGFGTENAEESPNINENNSALFYLLIQGTKL